MWAATFAHEEQKPTVLRTFLLCAHAATRYGILSNIFLIIYLRKYCHCQNVGLRRKRKRVTTYPKSRIIYWRTLMKSVIFQKYTPANRARSPTTCPLPRSERAPRGTTPRGSCKSTSRTVSQLSSSSSRSIVMDFTLMLIYWTGKWALFENE